MKQFQRFLVVGALGFIVDFAVLYLAVSVGQLGPLAGRFVSFLVAATVTWKANRHFTFSREVVATAAPGAAARQWLRYLSITALGGGINISVYQLWLTLTSHSDINLFMGVVAGSAAALAVNFALSKYVVFKR